MRRSSPSVFLSAAACLAGLLLTASIAPVSGQGSAISVPFTRAQADAGAKVYAQTCASCHGVRLDDGQANALVGPKFLDVWTAPGRTLDELYFITRTTMPKNQAALPTAEYVAVLAYLLERNGLTPGDRELTADPTLLAALRLTRPQQNPSENSATTKPPAPPFIAGTGSPTPRGSGPAHQTLVSAGDSRDWLMASHDYSGSRYSPSSQITTANVSQLRVVCAYQVGETGNFQTGPVVDRGTMYLTSIYATIALDAATCQPKWRHVWTPRASEPLTNNRGVAIKDGRVVRATNDGYLLSLDADDGRLLWARRVADSSVGETFTMAPLVFDDLIVIAPAVSEFAIKGWVGAFQLATGEQVWRFNIVPAAGEPGSETWSQPKEFPVGGGGVWTAPTLDVERETVFVATGNPAPDFPAELRGGANLFTNSVVALNVRTGKLVWGEQLVPADNHDWDLTHASPLYRATIGGRTRDLIGTVGKDGVLRVLDRQTRERIFETPVTTIENAKAPVTPAGTRACPGLVGGVEWNGPTYHPGRNLIAVPAVDWCATFYSDPKPRFVPGQIFMGGRSVNDKTSQGWITAVDAVSGAVRWKYRSPRPVIGAVTATAGNLILAGELTGDLVAFDAASGKVLYRFNTGGPIGAGIISYEAGGRQLIAVASGRPSRLWTMEHSGSPIVMVFGLDTGAR